jgi:hypothetical protein
MDKNWKGKERISQAGTVSELARNFSFVLPHVKHSILSGQQARILWSKESAVKSGKIRLSHQKGSRELNLFLFRSDQDEPVTGLSLELSSEPDDSDEKFSKDFLRVFNADVLTASSILVDKELWATLQQTRFARAIGRFSL